MAEPEPLDDRDLCPGCSAPGAGSLLDLPFDGPPVAGYLDRFYAGGLGGWLPPGSRFDLRRCVRCALVYQRYAPGPALLDHLYGRAAVAVPAEVAARRGLDTRLAYAGQIATALRWLGTAPAATPVLDFGAGVGLWLDMAAALGCPATGCELDADLRDRIAALGHPAVALDDLPDAAFAFVNAEQVLEHLVHPAEVLARLARAVRPGGLVRLAVPDGTGVAARLDRIRWDVPKDHPDSPNPVAPLEHLNCFDGPALDEIGRRAGLRPVVPPVRAVLWRGGRPREVADAVRARLRPGRGLRWFVRPVR
ncbi:MAG: class I SAM-dependent methyltransferase [Microthrixaceae bacterium]